MPRILFIPGYLCTGELFQYQLAQLPQGFEGIIADVPPLESMEEIASALWGETSDPLILCGLSMGGIIAMEMFAQRPDLVQGLILLDTNARSEGPEVSAARRKLVAEGEAIGPGEMSIRRLLPKLIHPSRMDDKGLRSLIYRMAEECGVERLKTHAKALETRPDYAKLLESVRIPTLIAYGEQDLLTPAERHEHIQMGIPHGELVAIPDCGHLSTAEKQSAVSDILNQWLEQNF